MVKVHRELRYRLRAKDPPAMSHDQGNVTMSMGDWSATASREQKVQIRIQSYRVTRADELVRKLAIVRALFVSTAIERPYATRVKSFSALFYLSAQ